MKNLTAEKQAKVAIISAVLFIATIVVVAFVFVGVNGSTFGSF